MDFLDYLVQNGDLPKNLSGLPDPGSAPAPAAARAPRPVATSEPAGGLDFLDFLDQNKAAAPPAAPAERTGWEAVKDTGAQLAEGANTVLGAVPSLIAPEGKVAQFFSDNADYWRNMQSEPLKARAQAAGAKIDEAGQNGIVAQIVEAAKQYTSDPGLAARFVTTNLPSMIPGIGAAKVAQAAALARGATAVRAGTAATGAAAGANAVLNAGGARGEGFEDIRDTLIKQGVSPEEATDLALRDSRVIAAVGGLAGALSGATGLEKSLINGAARAAPRSALAAGAKSAGAELAGEQVEEVAPKLTTNYQAGQYDNRPLGQDVGRTIVETAIGSGPGAIAGGIIDSVGQASANAMPQPDPETTPPASDPITDPIREIAGAKSVDEVIAAATSGLDRAMAEAGTRRAARQADIARQSEQEMMATTQQRRDAEQAELDDLIATEGQNLKLRRGFAIADQLTARQRAAEEQTIVDESRQALGALPEQQVAAAASADETGQMTAMQLAMQRARQRLSQKTATRSPEWEVFAPETGTIGIPRAEMPQIKAEHRGAMVNFMNARGVAHQEEMAEASDLKPTQAEYSPAKVQQAKDFTGGNRAILVSQDGHVLDGHHQLLAAQEQGIPVRIIRLDAPIDRLVKLARDFPSSSIDESSQNQPAAPEQRGLAAIESVAPDNVQNTPVRPSGQAETTTKTAADQTPAPERSGDDGTAAAGAEAGAGGLEAAGVDQPLVTAPQTDAARDAAAQAAQETAPAERAPQGKQVSFYPGKYGKGMGKEAAKLEAQRLNRVNAGKGITYAAEEHNDPKLENPYAVVGRKAVSQKKQAPAPAPQEPAATEKIADADQTAAETSELGNLSRAQQAAGEFFADATPAVHRAEADRITKVANGLTKLPDIKRRYEALAESHRLAADRKERAGDEGPAAADPADEIKATLDANNVTGRERLDVIKDVKAGALTVGEVKDAYPTKIDDIGEKIGGARKDTAVSTGARKKAASEDDGRPTWAKRFQIAQVAGGFDMSVNGRDITGKWTISDLRTRDRYDQPKRMGDYFDSREAAEAALPLLALAQKHRPVPVNAADGQKYEIWRDINDRKRVKVVDRQFDTRVEAMQYMAQNATEILETNTTFGEADLPKPESTARKGVERRTGDVKGEDFRDTFGFRGVEFGLWNNQDERQEVMNAAYDGLLDLADVLKVPPKAIGLDGDLALAFGARGKGLSGARAHYETNRVVMNLTKMNGAGALAHEWFHALDHYLARQDGKTAAEWKVNKDGTRSLEVNGGEADMASSGFRRTNSGVREELRAAYTSLVQSLFTKAEQYVEDTARADKFVAVARGELEKDLNDLRKDLSEQKDVRYYKRNNKPATAEQLAEFDTMAAELIEGRGLGTEWKTMPGKNRLYIQTRHTNDTLEKLNELYKAVRGRSGFNAERRGVLDSLTGYMRRYDQRLQMMREANTLVPKTKRVPTSFAMDAKSLDQGRGGDYWTTPHEMVARAFQGYVEDAIAAKEGRSPFLNYAPENVGILTPWGAKRPYPAGEERKAMNAEFEKFIDVLETKETDKGVMMFSRAAPAGPVPAMEPIQTKNGATAFKTPEIALANPRLNVRQPGGAVTRIDFEIRDRAVYARAIKNGDTPAQAKEEASVGIITLDMDAAGVFKSLRNIEVFESRRGSGIAEKVVGGIMESLPAGAALNIHDILPTATGFWDKMGAKFPRSEDTVVTANLTPEQFRSAYDSRTRAAGAQGQRQESRAAEYAGAGSGRSGADGAPAPRAVRNPSTVASVQAAVAELIGGKWLPNKLGRVVATTSAEIKSYWEPQIGQNVQLGSEGEAGQAQAFFDPRTKTVFLIADNIPAGDETAVAAHELMHKHGQAVLGQDGWDKLHGIISTWADAPEDSDERAVYNYARSRVEAVGMELSSQEMFPYAVEAAIKMGIKPSVAAKKGTVARWLASVKYAMQQAWGKITGKPETFKTQDLVDLAFGIAQMENPESAAAMGRITDAPVDTDSAKFQKWFGDSKVVDDTGKPLVVYHGTKDEFSEFQTDLLGAFFSSSEEAALQYGDVTVPAYLSLQKPMEVDAGGSAWDSIPFDAGIREVTRRSGLKFDGYEDGTIDTDTLAKIARGAGFDGLVVRNVDDGEGMGGSAPTATVAVAFRPEQIKSAIGNNGDFDPANPDIRFSRSSLRTGQPLPQAWQAPDASRMDDFIYNVQDKHVDTKRVVQSVRDAIGRLAENQDPYLQEELYHGRAAKATQDFLQSEIRPLLTDLQARGVDISDFEEYLHNRHAERRNVQVAKVNPAMPDGGSGIDTVDARAYLAGLPPGKRRAYEALAKHVDAINRETRDLLVSSGLEKQETIDAWDAAYGDEYVPLMREEMDGGGQGIGQGFSVKGGSSKRAMGSNKPVADILANIALQREKAITRSEKRRIGEALYGMVLTAPNPDFWFAVDPALQQDPAQITETANQLINMGMNPADADSIAAEPTQRYIDPRTNLVSERINPALRNADNVLAVRINGEDKFVFFNARDPRAMRMAKSLKNLDADQLGEVMGTVSKMTRYFSAINTQYNPIFGVVNVTRDIQAALLNLQSTPLKGKQGEVSKLVMPALRGIYIDLRNRRAGKPSNSVYASLFEEFQKEGGATGYRDMYANAKERAEAIADELQGLKDGTVKKAGKGIMGWLSDYNDSMENAVRLAAYKVGKDSGLSNQQAASIAKNLTTNFNRKGQIALQAGALWAFFNASVQGTARIGETMFKNGRLTGLGKKILTGGLMLGSMQAMLLAAFGFDDDEPPDFVRERSLVLPIGGSNYISIPMPLGFHVLPNLSRIPTEWALGGFKDTPKRIAQLVGLFADAFNPIGSAGLSLQTLTPTIIDPLAALAENRDFTGKAIYKKDFNSMEPTAGHTRAKDTATPWAKAMSYAVNWLTGGTDFKPGVASPTPDQIDYLIGQVTGGVGREVSKLGQMGESAITGEELPLYKIPLVGRFVGTTEGQAAASSRFYNNLKKIGEHDTELKGLKSAGRAGEYREYLADHPEAVLAKPADQIYRDVRKLVKAKREAVAAGVSRERVKLMEMQISSRMTEFNNRVKAIEEREAAEQ